MMNSKKVELKTADGKTYTLEFDRDSCAKMSRKGFRAEDLDKNPVVAIPLLIAGAFTKNHADLSRDEIDEIWESVSGKKELLKALMEMYAVPINALVAEPSDDSKNATWEVIG